MFGAKGDGITDDTEAIQKAIDKNDTIFMFGNYLTGNPIETNYKNIYCFGQINYTGDDVAVILNGRENNIIFHNIVSNGVGIAVENRRSDGKTRELSYCNIYCNITSRKDCIHFEINMYYNNFRGDRLISNMYPKTKNHPIEFNSISIVNNASAGNESFISCNKFYGFAYAHFKYGLFAENNTKTTCYENSFTNCNFESPQAVAQLYINGLNDTHFFGMFSHRVQ